MGFNDAPSAPKREPEAGEEKNPKSGEAKRVPTLEEENEVIRNLYNKDTRE